jgi:hypothetical protein
MPTRVAYINFWSDDRNERWLSHFIDLNVDKVEHVAASEEPDLLIASVFGPLDAVRQTKAKRKLFYYGENLLRFPEYADDTVLKDVFDLIVGFKPTQEDEKRVRFPLWLLFYPFYTFSETSNVIDHIEAQRKRNKAVPKEFLGSCVASHDMFGFRTPLYEATKLYGEFKCPAGFMKNAPSIGPTLEDKISFLSKGFYNLCAENSAFDSYCTEKIFHALEAGTVPIYWSKDRPEPEVLNPSAYCYADVSDQEDVKTKVSHCMEHRDAYLAAPIFTPQAKHVVSEYYAALKTSLERLLGLTTERSVLGISYASRQFAGRQSAIEVEARATPYFTSFTCLTETDVDNAFKESHRDVWNQPTGGGFWIWKPHLIRKQLETMKESDILVYLDSGCSLCVTDAAQKRFGEYLSMVRDHWTGMLRFQLAHKESSFTNTHMVGALERRFGRTMKPGLESGQLVGGILLVRRTRFSLSFFDTLLSILDEDEKLVTEVYTRPGETHRHDQSLSSMVYKAMGGSLIIPDETYFDEGFGSESSTHFPIWATRRSVS